MQVLSETKKAFGATVWPINESFFRYLQTIINRTKGKASKMRVFTTIILVCLSVFTAKSQYYYYNNNYYDKDLVWEVGASAGLMTGVTDIGSKKGIFPNFKASQTNASIYVGAMYQNIAGARLELTYGRIAGADSLGGAHEWRNLSYRTPITQIALIGEFHPLMLKYYDELPKFSPYIAAGLGWLNFNPQANLNGRWIDLQPLRTEGQGFPEAEAYRQDTRPYKLYTSSLIGGIGVKYDAAQLLTVRAELLYNQTFSDYLDDASTFYVDPAWFDANLSAANAALARQLYDRSGEKPTSVIIDPGDTRASSKSKDGFFTFNIKVAINLGRTRTTN